MSAGAFDVSVRAVECSGCGAPLTVPAGGGSSTCEFCGASNVIALRPVEEHRAPASAAEDVARMARLAAQKKEPLAGNPFDLRTPPEGLAEGDTPEALRGAFDRARARSDLARLGSAQRALCWIATRLADAHAGAGEHLRARAVLESSLDLLPDPGHRHILRCRLARLACRDEELDAAEGWLSECDPAPEVLALDTELRLARAELDLRRKEPEVALERLGDTRGKLPMSAELEADAELLRLVAKAQQGRADEVQGQLWGLAYGDARALQTLRASGLVPELVEAHEQAEAAAERRVRIMAPIAWACSPLAVVATVVIMNLVRAGTLDPDGYYALMFAGAMIVCSLGMGLGIGATKRQGGIWWGAPLLGAFALVPVGGLLTILIISITVANAGGPDRGVPYSKAAERPFHAGLVTLGVLVLVMVVWSATLTT